MSGYSIDLSGKTAVVTGASSGIGAAIVRHLGDAGASTVAVGRDADRLAQVCDSAAGSTQALNLDITAENAPAEIVDAALGVFGRLDVVVHAAGIYIVTPLTETTDLDLDRQWDVNVRAPFRITRAAVPHLSRGSSVVFISSILGGVGGDSCSAYCATKGAVEQLSAGLTVELAHKGIRFNCIAPGAIESPMNEQLRSQPGFYEELREFAPAKRWGTVDEIAPAVVFLASDAAGFVHGARLAIDGGWVAR